MNDLFTLLPDDTILDISSQLLAQNVIALCQISKRLVNFSTCSIFINFLYNKIHYLNYHWTV